MRRSSLKGEALQASRFLSSSFPDLETPKFLSRLKQKVSAFFHHVHPWEEPRSSPAVFGLPCSRRRGSPGAIGDLACSRRSGGGE